MRAAFVLHRKAASQPIIETYLSSGRFSVSAADETNYGRSGDLQQQAFQVFAFRERGQERMIDACAEPL
ncbi:hypothetical protein AWB68_05031 [Caballeronia choica]|uniref:Uncharacterized protein n=1 Tax=Caballeronia choica TaxID=326476 RepID=A0A158K6B5_9BURK|nr:hypothetical protein AWB68_05031 [Caballeronia choica]